VSHTFRRSAFVGVLASFALFNPVRAGAADLGKSREVQLKVTDVQKHLGFDDPKTTLQEALDQIAKKFDLTFDVNQKAFAAAEIKDVANTLPFETHNLPEFTGTLDFMLRKILDRLPGREATYIIRDGVVEITTKKAVREEFFRDRPADAPLPPLVNAALVQTPLTAALRDLARSNGGNIVLDVRATKEAQTNVTAEFANVPLDTAVALLADMCGLTSVDVGNVIYVTSRENARVLQQEQEKRRLKILDRPVEPK
jgi:hypothetical protein